MALEQLQNTLNNVASMSTMAASLAAVPALQLRSPARPKSAAQSTTTTSTNGQKSNRARQRSNEEQREHIDSTAQMVSKASREDDVRRMTENFEDEVRLHRADLVRSIELARQQLIHRLDAITPALIDSLAEMSVQQFVEVHNCDLFAAHRAVKLGSLTEANDEINRTIKKRKRIVTAGTDSANNTAATDEDACHTGSPVKGRKNMRIAPPTPKMGNSTSITAFPRSASRPGGLHTSNATTARARAAATSHASAPTQITRGAAGSSRYSSTATARPSTSSNAGNFIYKARPSLTVPTNFNGPRLPQTPKAFGAGTTGSLGTARTAGKSAARRLPRKLESIQAYSMNGSPLGMFDLAVEQAGATSSASHSSDPATSANPSSQSGVEEDWEILSNNTTAPPAATAMTSVLPPVANALPPLSRQTSNTPLGKTSPSKLGRKPSHSAFKDKILAGATKAFGGGSHMQNRFTSPIKSHTGGAGQAPPSAGSSGYSLARPPTREQFTFQTTPALPSIPSQSNALDKLEAMKADLARMCPDPEQRKMFEQRYLEIMRTS